MDGTCVKIGDNDRIMEFIPKNVFNADEVGSYYKTVNVYRFLADCSSRYYVPFMGAYRKAFGENEYYEQVLRAFGLLGEPLISALRLDGEKWYEIDNETDLKNASSLFATC